MKTINDLYLDDAGFLICKENQTSKEWDSLITELFKDWKNLQAENEKLKKLISKVRWHTTIHPDSTLMGEIEEALEAHPDFKGGADE